MVIISCSTKFWAFELAEQLEFNSMFGELYTTYSSEKNFILKHFVRRRDKENIPVKKIHTFGILALLMKSVPAESYQWNNLFDNWVASKLKSQSGRIFIGWSGMSLKSIRKARQAGLKVILERGSSHIEFQSDILTEEYRIHNLEFKKNPALIRREIQEYSEADYIAVPSNFVKQTFLQKGISEKKIFVNPYGVNIQKSSAASKVSDDRKKFKIVYLGTVSFRKGITYLFDALKLLSIPSDKYEMVFIGKIDEEFSDYCRKNKKDEWIFLGHIDQYQLSSYLESADIGVIPSIEDGFAMVVPQILSAGVPVITTYNTGACEMIKDGENGFVIDIRNFEEIADRIEKFYNDPQLLNHCKTQAYKTVNDGFTWKDYGRRYVEFLRTLDV